MPARGHTLIDTPATYSTAPPLDVSALRAVFEEVLNDWYDAELGRLFALPMQPAARALSVTATADDYHQRCDAWSAAGGGDL